MILIDTHIWIWWVNQTDSLSDKHRRVIESHEATGIGVSAISCWETSKLVELGRLKLKTDVENWIDLALAYPGVRLVELTPRIAVESTRLPPPVHRDPADQIIIASARVLDCPLLTADERILNYPHVKLA